MRASRTTLFALILLAVVIVIAVATLLIPSRETVSSDTVLPVPPTPESIDYSGITLNRVLPKDIKLGKGTQPSKGQTVEGLYRMWIYNPKALGNKGPLLSPEEASPVKFRLGSNEVIQGWSEGLQGMAVGGQREIIIPPEFAYGKAGTKEVPAGSFILIEFELVRIHD